jgi:catechol 2,3-dioxygenase-like lactoylglutathione lyase family enzyme
MAQPSDVPRLFRTILPVSNIDQAERFYGNLLGIAGERVAPNRHYFHCGPTILALVDPEAGTFRPNLDHVYFAVKDLEAFHGRARSEQGVEVDEEIKSRPWGERSFYLKDPFGNPICFVDEATLFLGHRR